jgi:hypothetical protein
MPNAHVVNLTMASLRHLDGTSNRQCPLCGAFLVRIPRRLRDRLVSIATPIQRYQCIEFTCDWEGNLRTADEPAPNGGSPR